jgi:hypothetical protein
MTVLVLVIANPMAAPARVSVWGSPSETIDGHADEWTALVPLDITRVSLGVQNDGHSLYLAIASSDQTRRRQLVIAGLVVWFDAEDKKRRVFGIRVPGTGLPGSVTGDPQPPTTPPDAAPAPRDEPQHRAQATVPPVSYVEIIGPGENDRRRLELEALRSIKVARGQQEGSLVMELQIPLAKNDSIVHAIGARPGQQIGLGFETPAMERPERAQSGRTGGGRGGFGGGIRGGAGGGGMGGRGTGGPPQAEVARAERPDPLKVWTSVLLAATER